ncbi:MAG: 50S ribosomal protein L10 [Christensenellales bacterium]|uniref:Large ribosomal subunit protein uL10 n=1 Tax=Candidatus Avichristensenella intestinipullorum TaxID=2840693 RepID=A0A9D1CIW0_9FIRM|nr:50S ribosomal protein L10 [Christensenellales bacterium]HIQ62748.1 50S ribosomal protein L10 [Candidatus Avichristensenella intestinipullorum]
MSKNFELKQQVVADIKAKFEKAGSVVIVDYRGINVEQVTELRKQFRGAGVEYVVLKNTLVKRALAELNIEGLDTILEGPSAFAFGYEDPVAPAKVLSDFIGKTKSEHLKIKAGLVDGKVIDVAGVKALADLPPKEVLIAKMMGSLNAPITNFVGVLSATLRSLVYAIDAIRKQKGGEA